MAAGKTKMPAPTVTLTMLAVSCRSPIARTSPFSPCEAVSPVARGSVIGGICPETALDASAERGSGQQPAQPASPERRQERLQEPVEQDAAHRGHHVGRALAALEPVARG